MPLVPLTDVLQPALRDGYAVGAFNTFNEDFTDAIITAAAVARAPVIVSVSEVQLDYVDLECIAAVTRAKSRHADIPVVLHLDHGMTLETIQKAIDLGFTSVMFDGSALPYEQNREMTGQVRAMCGGTTVSVEAELGAVGGSETGDLGSIADEQMYTDVEQALDFVRTTRVDALAVAIGNAHGAYIREPCLDFTRLQMLNDALRLPMVLHGGSGISDDDFRRAVDNGITKINFYTGMLNAAINRTAERITDCGQRYNDYLDVLASVRDAVSSVVGSRISVFLNGRRP